MRKGPWTIAAAIAAGAVITTPTWAAASPTATTAPPPPRAGAYDGRTSQGLRISLLVANSRKTLSTVKFGFRLHCADHRTLLFTVSPIVAKYPWRLNFAKGTGFSRTFRDTTGERYTVTGRRARSRPHGTPRATASARAAVWTGTPASLASHLPAHPRRIRNAVSAMMPTTLTYCGHGAEPVQWALLSSSTRAE
jgi:hypothetical protein